MVFVMARCPFLLRGGRAERRPVEPVPRPPAGAGPRLLRGTVSGPPRRSLAQARGHAPRRREGFRRGGGGGPVGRPTGPAGSPPRGATRSGGARSGGARSGG